MCFPYSSWSVEWARFPLLCPVRVTRYNVDLQYARLYWLAATATATSAMSFTYRLSEKWQELLLIQKLKTSDLADLPIWKNHGHLDHSKAFDVTLWHNQELCPSSEYGLSGRFFFSLLSLLASCCQVNICYAWNKNTTRCFSNRSTNVSSRADCLCHNFFGQMVIIGVKWLSGNLI